MTCDIIGKKRLFEPKHAAVVKRLRCLQRRPPPPDRHELKRMVPQVDPRKGLHLAADDQFDVVVLRDLLDRLVHVLREQLESATEWRGRLVQERHNAAATNNLEVVKELDGRISEFGDRAVRLERQLLATEDAISQAVINGVGRERGVNVEIAPIPPIPPIPRFITTEPPGGSIARERVGMMMLGETLLFALLAVVLWRTAFRRGARSVQVGAGGGPQNTAQLQQSIDAIAVEVERISENQRFVTKLLNEQGAGAQSQP